MAKWANRIIPWLLVVGGAVLIVTAGTTGVQQFMAALTPVAQWQTPGSQQVELTAGNWVVYQEIGQPLRPTARAPQQSSGSGLLAPDAVTVTGPQGRVATNCVYCTRSETLTLGTTTYTGLVMFTAPVDGQYTLTTESGGASLALAPPALQTVSQTFASLAWIGLGAVLLAAGTVWLIVLLILYLTNRSEAGGS